MSAILSDDEVYRYVLQRVLPSYNLEGEKLIYAFFGVNPSTADAVLDDHTVRKWIGFVQRWRGSRFLVGNLFAYRSTDVKKLATAADPVGPENDHYLRRIIAVADVLVPCWGSGNKIPKGLRWRMNEVEGMLKDSGKPVMTFGLTGSLDPKHPLMLPYDTPLVPWNQPAIKIPA